MISKRLAVLISLIFVVVLIFLFFNIKHKTTVPVGGNLQATSGNKIIVNPLSLTEMRSKSYPGSDLKFEKTLANSIGYKSYIVSYLSEGLRIYALLDVPTGQKPKDGWPVIVFNHGYIPPAEYRTTERYTTYVNAFANAGYIVIKPDYRGNGSSEGQPEGAYYSPAYTCGCFKCNCFD